MKRANAAIYCDRRFGGPISNRRKLARWLVEWNIHVRIQIQAGHANHYAGASHVSTNQAGGLPGFAYDQSGPAERKRLLAAGQTRLLQPGPVVLPQQRPVYVALLCSGEAGSWLAAPFSRFANPAVPGELITGLRPAPLRILCLWNARFMSAALLEQAWFSSVIPRALLRKCLDLREYLRAGSPIPGSLIRRIGPPLAHPLDPRHDYLQEELGMMETFLPAGREEAKDDTGLSYEMPRAALMKAAEGKAPYGGRDS